MVRNSRCTDRGRLHKGIGLLLCIGAWLPLCSQAGDWRASFISQTFSSHGLLEVSHWQSRQMHVQPHRVDAVMRSDLALSRQTDWGVLTVSRTTRGNYQGDSNVLTAMALNDLPGAFPLPPPGRYPLQAKSQQLLTHDLTFSRTFGKTSTFQATGHLYLSYVVDYQRTQGQALLQTLDRDARIEGRIQRWGTRHYGFLVEDQDDAGQGLGLDLDVLWNPGKWRIEARIEHLLHHIHLSPMHWSERQYDVRALDGQLVIQTGDDFSMTGRYGLTRGNQRMPAWGRIGVGHQDVKGWRTGLLHLNQRWQGWLGYRSQPARWQWGVSTIGGQNLMLEALWSPANGTQWGLGLNWTNNSGAAVGQVVVRYPI